MAETGTRGSLARHAVAWGMFLLTGCAVPPRDISGVAAWNAVYRNWTGVPARLRLQLTAARDASFEVPAGRASAAAPIPDSTSSSMTVDFDDVVPAGGCFAFEIRGRGLRLASGMAALWLDAGDREIARSRTGSLMNRRALLDPVPLGGSDFRLEYDEEVAGVWFEQGAVRLEPRAVTLLGLTRPIHAAVDFVSPGPEGPRRGRRGWGTGGLRESS